MLCDQIFARMSMIKYSDVYLFIAKSFSLRPSFYDPPSLLLDRSMDTHQSTIIFVISNKSHQEYSNPKPLKKGRKHPIHTCIYSQWMSSKL